MDSRQLRYFSAVCTYKNLSHAADHCSVAQSAISHHIANLEAELNTKLFVRKPRGMEPTADGLRLFQHATNIIGAIDDAIEDVKTGQMEVSGNICIAMPYTVIQHIGIDLLRETLENYPRVNLLLSEGLSAVVMENLRKRQADFVLAYNPLQDIDTTRELLVEEPVYCIGTREIMGDSQDPILLEDVLKLPLVLLKSGALSRSQTDKPYILHRLEQKARLQLASVAATLGALESGIGCTIAPRIMVKSLLKRHLLTARKVIEPELQRSLYLVQRVNNPPTVLREQMLALVRKLVADKVNAGKWDSKFPDISDENN